MGGGGGGGGGGECFMYRYMYPFLEAGIRGGILTCLPVYTCMYSMVR